MTPPPPAAPRSPPREPTAAMLLAASQCYREAKIENYPGVITIWRAMWDAAPAPRAPAEAAPKLVATPAGYAEPWQIGEDAGAPRAEVLTDAEVDAAITESCRAHDLDGDMTLWRSMVRAGPALATAPVAAAPDKEKRNVD